MKNTLRMIVGAFAALAICAASTLCAQTPEEYFMLGNSAYKAGDYQKAAENYGLAEKNGLKTAELYFNRANANVKKGSPALALADYLKAISISPRMREASANLKILSKEASLQIPDMSSAFFELSKGEWIAAAVAAFWACALVIVIPPLYGKGGKLSWFLALVLFIAFGVSAYGIKAWLDFESLGVVVKQDAPMRISPSPNSPVELHAAEGQILKLMRKGENFSLASAPNGKQGWVKNSDIAFISD